MISNARTAYRPSVRAKGLEVKVGSKEFVV